MVFRLDGFYSPSVPKLKWDAKQHKYVREPHGHGGGHDEHEEEKHGDEHGHGGDEHGGGHEEHAHDPLGDGGWMFLFIDLVLVALTSKCALVMVFCTLSPHSFIFSATVFTVMFLTRQYLDEYCNRFYSNDFFHRLCYFLYVGAFFTMALNVNAKENHSHMDYKCKANLYGVGFGVGFVMTRGIMGILYACVMFDEPNKAFEQFCGPLVRSVLVCTVVILLMFAETQSKAIGNKGPFPPADRVYIYLIATIIEWAYDVFHNVVLAFKKTGVDIPPVLVSLEYYPLELMVYQERLGAFIMLVLGESMICLLIPYFDVNFASATYTFHLISYGIIFCFGIMYYDGANHGETVRTHAVNHSLLSAFLYFWIHVFVGLSIFYTSASMGILYLAEVATDGGSHGDDYTPDPTPEDDRSYPVYIGGKIVSINPMDAPICKPVQLLAAGVGMCTVFLALMRTLHRGLDAIWNCEPDAKLAQERWSMAWRIGCGIFHFTVPFYGLVHPSANAGIHLGLLLVMLMLEIKFGPKEEPEEDEKEGHGAHAHEPPRHDPRSAAAVLHNHKPTMEMLSVPRRGPHHAHPHPLDNRRPSVSRRPSEMERGNPIHGGSPHMMHPPHMMPRHSLHQPHH